MGHHSHHKAYKALQHKIDKSHTGYPESELSLSVLRLIFSPEEAELVSRLPLRLRTARFIARRVGRDEVEVTRMLERMADKGLILDVHNPEKDRMYYCVAPPVVGFVEFTLMRRRTDVDQKQLSELFDRFYDPGGESFIEGIMDAETTIGRALAHEQTLAPDDLAELLTHDRATSIVREARSIAVSLCYCRHKAEHLGHRCDRPMENCMSLNIGADYVIRHGQGKAIDSVRALEILEQSREEGLVYIADNVQRRVTYVCSCCGCCCGQLQAINRFGLPNAVKTSAYCASIDSTPCTGCGRCARKCPIQAIEIHALPPHVKRKARMYSKVDENICLGCGVCKPACRKGALTMKPRAERVLTPEGTLERVLTMALERGRLHNLLFEEEDGPHMMMLNRLTGAILKMPPVRRALLRDTLKSRFVGYIADTVRGIGGEPTKL